MFWFILQGHRRSHHGNYQRRAQVHRKNHLWKEEWLVPTQNFWSISRDQYFPNLFLGVDQRLHLYTYDQVNSLRSSSVHNSRDDLTTSELLFEHLSEKTKLFASHNLEAGWWVQETLKRRHKTLTTVEARGAHIADIKSWSISVELYYRSLSLV